MQPQRRQLDQIYIANHRGVSAAMVEAAFRRQATVAPGAANDNCRHANDNDSLGRVRNRWAAETEEVFAYDGLGRLTSYNTPLGNFTFAYQGHTGRVTSKSVNGGTLLSQTYGYDTVANDRRLLTITSNTAGARSYTLGYGYTENSVPKTDRFNIRSIAESAGAGHPTGTQSWAYVIRPQ